MSLPVPAAVPSIPDPPLRVGVVGLGFAGTAALDAFRVQPGVRVVALAGQEEARLAELVESREVPSAYHDWQDLVARDDLDVVSVGVPNHLHAPIAIAALESGKHVLCEKPLAPTGELAQRMVDAATTNDRVLEVVFNHRRRSDVQYLKRYLDETGIGRVYHARTSWRRRAGIPGLGSWFTDRELAGGGPMIDLGPHMLDIALFLMGEPHVQRVSAVTYGELGRAGRGGSALAKTTGRGHAFEVEDFGSALLRLDTGASLQLEASWASYSVDEEDIRVELLGSEGGVRLFVRHYATEDTVRIYTDVAGAPAVTVPTVHGSRGPGAHHVTVVAEFVATVRSGDWSQAHGQGALHRTRVLDAVYRSAAEGREVEVA